VGYRSIRKKVCGGATSKRGKQPEKEGADSGENTVNSMKKIKERILFVNKNSQK
jgi:hypothetical protein